MFLNIAGHSLLCTVQFLSFRQKLLKAYPSFLRSQLLSYRALAALHTARWNTICSKQYFPIRFLNPECWSINISLHRNPFQQFLIGTIQSDSLTQDDELVCPFFETAFCLSSFAPSQGFFPGGGFDLLLNKRFWCFVSIIYPTGHLAVISLISPLLSLGLTCAMI